MSPSPGTTLPSPAGLRRVASNAGFLLLAYVLPRGLTFAAIVVAARVLGAEDFGYYGTAGAYAVILSILATLGMMPLLIREIAQAPGRAAELVRAAHFAKTASNAVMITALLVLAVYVLDYPRPVVAAAALLGLAYAIGAYVENLGAYFQAIERMDIWLRGSAIYGLVTGLLGAVIVLATSNLVLFAAAAVAGQLAALIWLNARMPHRPFPRPASPFPVRDVERLLKALIPFAASFVILTVFYKSDVLLLARWSRPVEVGLYTAAYKFADITVALATVAVGAMYPRLSRVAPQARGQGEWAGTRIAELVLLGSVPVAALLWLARAPVVQMLFGGEYVGTAEAVGFVAPALPALTLNIFAGYLLAAFGRMGRVAAVYGGGLILKVLLNALWIPRLGAGGAALAMLSAEWVVSAAFVLTLAHAIGALPRLRAVGLAAAAGSAAIPVVALTEPLGALSSTVIYGLGVGLLYWAAAVVRPEERVLLRRAFFDNG